MLLPVAYLFYFFGFWADILLPLTQNKYIYYFPGPTQQPSIRVSHWHCCGISSLFAALPGVCVMRVTSVRMIFMGCLLPHAKNQARHLSGSDNMHHMSLQCCSSIYRGFHLGACPNHTCRSRCMSGCILQPVQANKFRRNALCCQSRGPSICRVFRCVVG